jgi:hypothetical protein
LGRWWSSSFRTRSRPRFAGNGAARPPGLGQSHRRHREASNSPSALESLSHDVQSLLLPDSRWLVAVPRWTAPIFVLGAPAATYVHGDKYPTEAARPLDGNTYTATAIVALVMSLLMSRFDVSRSPGVSRRMIKARAPRCSAEASASCGYSAENGLIPYSYHTWQTLQTTRLVQEVTPQPRW